MGTTQNPCGILIRSAHIFCHFPVNFWAGWCFTFEIFRVPIPVCGSNIPPARALWLKNHWNLVSFLRFVACLKSTFQSQNTFDSLIPGCPNMNNHLHSSRIWEFPFFVKTSAPNKPSPYCHWSAAKHLHKHCSCPLKITPKIECWRNSARPLLPCRWEALHSSPKFSMWGSLWNVDLEKEKNVRSDAFVVFPAGMLPSSAGFPQCSWEFPRFAGNREGKLK